jgi:hypothetical protein
MAQNQNDQLKMPEMLMPKASKIRSCLVLLVGALSICVAFTLDAQTNSENYGSIDLGQGDPAVVSANSQGVANNACAPAAVANGLAYLYGLVPSYFTSNPDNDTAVNALISAMGTGTTGTTGPNALSGLQTYLGPSGANPTSPKITLSQTADPTAASLGTALAAGSAVQLGILWGALNSGTFTSGNDGGHFVSLTGMSISTSTGSGTMTILDPWGVGSGASSPYNSGTTGADTLTLTVTTITYNSGTYLEVQYPSPSSVNPQDTTSKNNTAASSYGISLFDAGIINLDEIETIPEPTTMSLLLLPLGAGMLQMLRKNRSA